MIVIDHDARSQRFATRVEGVLAVLDYRLADRVMTITHTLVPPRIGGRGIAAELTRAALAAAREAGWTVNPVCSYAAAYVRKHPGHADNQQS